MKKIFLLICLLSQLVIGCNTTHHKVSENFIEINYETIPILNSNTSLIESVQYIPLETGKDILVSDIDKILFADNCFYILDLQQKTIFIFNLNGKFKSKINKVGRGPGEYIGINDFDIDKNQNIYIWDNASDKVIKYLKNNQNHTDFKLKNRFEEFCIANDNTLIVKNLYNEGKITSRISKYNIENNKTEKFIGINEGIDNFDLIRFSQFYLFKSNNDIYYNPRFTNMIYKVSDNGIEQKFKINGPIPPIDFINKIKKDPSIVYTEDKYITDIRNIYETPKLFSITVQKQLIYNLLISKSSNKQLLLPGIQDKNYFGNNAIYGVAGDKFISSLDFDNMQEGGWTEKIKRSNLAPGVKTTLVNIKTDDNPVLILIKFKEF
jgi:hypothetical protein